MRTTLILAIHLDCAGGGGMKITVQIAIQSEEGQTAVFKEVACLERGALRPDTLGLSLTEARSILAALEQTMAERQTAEFVAQAGRCPRCGRQRACKGHHAIVFRTPFGKLSLDSPQLYRCPCEPPGPKTVSPLAELLPERTSPELAYLETKFAALMSYGLTVKLLEGGVADCRGPQHHGHSNAGTPHG
jgi:hypothetical protein